MKATKIAGNAAKTGGTASVSTTSPQTAGAIDLLKQDHRNVEALFSKFETAEAGEKSEIATQVCRELIIHAMLEEEIFYPACREHDDEEALDEAQVEHDGAKLLIADVMRQSPGDAFYDAKVKVLAEYIKHHVGEEEKPGAGIFAKAQKAGLDMAALGERLLARKKELMAKAESDQLPSPMTRALDFQLNQVSKKEELMNRQSNNRDRDDRGRFTGDDDDRGYSRGYSSRRDGDDDRRYAREGSGSYRRDDNDDDRRRGWSGDYEGHSQASRHGWEGRRSEDRYEDDGRGYRSSSRYDAEDGDRGYARGRSSEEGRGWYGDPRGHSEASRLGWEERRSGGRYGDDDGREYRSRNRDDDDDGRRGQGGRSRDAEGRFESSGNGGGQGGRSRDAEGRFQSADDRGSSSSSRRSSEDDDDRRSGRDHGGWYGDSRGHAEASRRGWRNR